MLRTISGHFLANYDSSLSFEYTIDIKPGPSSEIGIKSVLYKKDEEILNGKPGNFKMYFLILFFINFQKTNIKFLIKAIKAQILNSLLKL